MDIGRTHILRKGPDPWFLIIGQQAGIHPHLMKMPEQFPGLVISRRVMGNQRIINIKYDAPDSLGMVMGIWNHIGRNLIPLWIKHFQHNPR